MTRPLVLLGAGGHAKVLLSLARAAGLIVTGVCDPELARRGVAQWRDVSVLGGDEMLDALDPGLADLINGVGQLVAGNARQRLYERMKHRGFCFPVLLHPSATIDPTAQLEQGVQVMAGAIVQADCHVGENCIINTSASIDHDCAIGAHVHVAPGAVLCGNVQVHEYACVGSGATVIQGLSIGRGAVVGAGTTAVRDLPDGRTLLGAAMRLRPESTDTQEELK